MTARLPVDTPRKKPKVAWKGNRELKINRRASSHAYYRAKKIWGTGEVRSREAATGNFTCMVGFIRETDGAFCICGTGQTWEEAFGNAGHGKLKGSHSRIPVPYYVNTTLGGGIRSAKG